MNFQSDNVGTACSEIMEALKRANHGTSAPYGEDDSSRRLNERFSELFEKEVAVFPVATGTAANALSLSSCARPWGGIFCHESAHINIAECGATEFFSGGAKLLSLPGQHCRIAPDTLRAALAQSAEAARRGMRNRAQPDLVSITQASERGTLYTLDEIAAFGEMARSHGMRMHMDGARFANALARLACSPAEMTWRRGVDILSFGATKNGAMNTDAIVVFDPALSEGLWYRLRRAGQTWSKMRFAVAQLNAYVEDGLFVRLAARANAHADRLAEGLQAMPGVSLECPVEANMLFVRMPAGLADYLVARGVGMLRQAENVVRLVVRFDNTRAEIEQFLSLARSFVAGKDES